MPSAVLNRVLAGGEQARQERLAAEVRAVLQAEPRYLMVPASGGGFKDVSRNARVVTNVASPANRQYGRLPFVTLNGSTQYATVPDAADLTFSTGAADQVFSGGALIRQPSAIAAFQDIISKYGGAVGEYELRLTNASPPLLQLLLQSALGTPTRATDTGITVNDWISVGFSYDATGGATAANGITLYMNGVVKASTAANDAAYTFMTNQTDVPGIGARGTGVIPYQGGVNGGIAVAWLGALNATAVMHARLHDAMRAPGL